MQDEGVVETLSQEEAWEFLGSSEFGRLAFAVAGDPEIVPINFCAVDEKVYFRTAEGSKLLAITHNVDVAFEVDEIGEDAAFSVVLHGSAHELVDREAAWVDTLPLRPWVPTTKCHVLAIEPHQVSGRRFHLDRPWRHMVPAHPVAPRTL